MARGSLGKNEQENTLTSTQPMQTNSPASTPPAHFDAAWKEALGQYFFERGYNQDDIRQLFRAVDWMITLPDELQQSFEAQVTRYQKERNMPLLSHMEVRAEKRGSLLTARESVLEALDTRFEAVPTEVADLINQIEDKAQLKHLHRQAITVASLEEFQQLLLQDIEP